MTSVELKPGYEQVFTVTDYYDGVRKGIANFNGQPHFYDCLFDEAEDEYSDLYRLTPIAPYVFDLAKEDWAIWQRWELAFRTGRTTLESHPALPQDRARHEEIRAVLDSALRRDRNDCIIRAGSFEPIGSRKDSSGDWGALQVRWTDPKTYS